MAKEILELGIDIKLMTISLMGLEKEVRQLMEEKKWLGYELACFQEQRKSKI